MAHFFEKNEAQGDDILFEFVNISMCKMNKRPELNDVLSDRPRVSLNMLFRKAFLQVELKSYFLHLFN